MECPSLLQPKPSLTLTEYARDVGHNYSSAVLELLPGQHSLSLDITAVNFTRFAMVGSSVTNCTKDKLPQSLALDPLH